MGLYDTRRSSEDRGFDTPIILGEAETPGPSEAHLEEGEQGVPSNSNEEAQPAAREEPNFTARRQSFQQKNSFVADGEACLRTVREKLLPRGSHIAEAVAKLRKCVFHTYYWRRNLRPIIGLFKPFAYGCVCSPKARHYEGHTTPKLPRTCESVSSRLSTEVALRGSRHEASTRLDPKRCVESFRGGS